VSTPSIPRGNVVTALNTLARVAWNERDYAETLAAWHAEGGEAHAAQAIALTAPRIAPVVDIRTRRVIA